MLDFANKPVVLIVDDDSIIRAMLRQMLESSYQVVDAEDGEAALRTAQNIKPTAIIADVQMPKMDGFALCKAIGDHFELSDIPVMLMSAEENTDELLKVYDVGGQGFITKPINHKVLLSHTAHMLQISAERAKMKSQINYATSTAFTAMSSMGETGLLMETLKNFNTDATALGLAQQLIAALLQFQLDGIIQIKTDSEIVALNPRGKASVIELAVLQKMARMERIVRFHDRLSINYPNVQLIINNMPQDDEERCGRLRDHLAIMIEAAESRIDAIKLKSTATQNQLTVMNSIKSLTGTLSEIDQQQRQGNIERTAIFGDVMMQMEGTLSAFGLSDQQETNLLNVVRDGWEKVAATYTDEAVLQNKLSQVVQTLKTSLEEI